MTVKSFIRELKKLDPNATLIVHRGGGKVKSKLHAVIGVGKGFNGFVVVDADHRNFNK